MKAFVPLTVTEAMLTSNVGEPEPVYSVAETYPQDATVRGAGIYAHALYVSLQGDNLGHPLTDTAWWLPAGSTNRWRMFDASVGSQTVNPDVIEVSIEVANLVTGIAVANVSASDLQLIVTDPIDGLVRNETYPLIDDTAIGDWWAYFYEPITRKTYLAITDLPPYAGATFTVRLSDPGASVKCGALVLGVVQDLGYTKWGARLGIDDYSVKKRDAFGNYSVVPRAFSRRASFDLWIENSRVDRLVDLLASLRATPTVFIGDERFGSMTVFGFIRSFEVTIPYPDISMWTLDTEGLAQ